MAKYSKLLLLIILLGCLASCDVDSVNPAETRSQEEITTFVSDASDSLANKPDAPYTPALQAVDSRHKSAAGRVEIAAYGEPADENYDDVCLWAEETVFDMLISEVASVEDNDSAPYIETDFLLYVPALSPGQCVKLYGFKGITGLYIRVAYTNSRGEYEAVLLVEGEMDDLIQAVPMPFDADEESFDQENDWYFQMLPEDFRTKMSTGVFDAFVPKGFHIASGSLGDVNADGVEDALIGLVSSYVHRPGISGIMPLFVLTGRPDGGYELAQKVPGALFLPYRSTSKPIAGEGYIDIMYYYVGGAACHHTVLSRFVYDENEKDWLLESFSYRQSYTMDYETELPPELVRALPHSAHVPLDKFKAEVYELLPDWNAFDATAALTVPVWGGDYHYIYTLGVNVNEQTGHYEGYIYKHFESIDADCFEQTVRGVLKKGSEITIVVNEEERVFQIQDDVWILEPIVGEGFYRAED